MTVMINYNYSAKILIIITISVPKIFAAKLRRNLLSLTSINAKILNPKLV